MADTDPIVRDLMRKCGDDIAETILRTAMLAPTAMGTAIISVSGAASALGVAAGAIASTCDEPPEPEEAADALWDKLRPMVIRAFMQIRAEQD